MIHLWQRIVRLLSGEPDPEWIAEQERRAANLRTFVELDRFYRQVEVTNRAIIGFGCSLAEAAAGVVRAAQAFQGPNR